MSIETTGMVAAVCMSPIHGFPTYIQERVMIGPLGIEGDVHAESQRESFRNPGTFKPNDRPISVVADEVRQEMNALLGINMQPGDFGEQVLVSRLGDLGELAVGDQMVFETGVVLEMVDRAFPCSKLVAHNQAPGLVKSLVIRKLDGTIYSGRGILAKVLQPGELYKGVGAIIVPALVA